MKIDKWSHRGWDGFVCTGSVTFINSRHEVWKTIPIHYIHLHYGEEAILRAKGRTARETKALVKEYLDRFGHSVRVAGSLTPKRPALFEVCQGSFRMRTAWRRILKCVSDQLFPPPYAAPAPLSPPVSRPRARIGAGGLVLALLAGGVGGVAGSAGWEAIQGEGPAQASARGPAAGDTFTGATTPGQATSLARMGQWNR